MEIAKEIASRLFTDFGFSVSEIAVSNKKSADLRLNDESATYHVEVKEKFESADDATIRVAALNATGQFDSEAKLSRDNCISGILRSAHKQLEQTGGTGGEFQLIWFHAHGIDADLKYRQAFATFYGDVHVAPRWPHNNSPTKHCFYFDYSAALAMPSVEALILCDGKQVQFCLNEASKRSDEFRKSGLFLAFKERDAVYDPLELERQGEIVFCRSQIPRKCDDDTAAELQKQTGVSFTPLRMKRYTSSIAMRPGAMD